MSYPIISVTNVINNSYEYNLGEGKKECSCAVCGDEWARSAPREFWIECMKCKEWTHSEDLYQQSVYFNSSLVKLSRQLINCKVFDINQEFDFADDLFHSMACI